MKPSAGWDATDRAGQMDKGAITLVLDLTNAFQWVSLPVVWAWATHFDFSSKIFAGALAGTSSIRGACGLKGALWSRSRPSRPSSLDPNGALSDVMKVYLPSKLKVFVDDIKSEGDEKGSGRGRV